MEKLRILLFEGCSQDTLAMMEAIRSYDQECEVILAETEAQYTSALRQSDLDVILCDSAATGCSDMRALQLARQQHPDIPFIFITSTGGENLAIEGLRHGATDYVVRQRMERLMPAVRRAVSEHRDRHRRQLIERQLRESEQRWHLVTETVPDMIWRCCAAGECVYANRRWYEQTGFTREQTLGSGLLDAIHPDDRSAYAARWHRSQEEAKVHESEVRLHMVSGGYRWHRIKAMPVFDESGKVTQWVAACVDIDGHKQASAAKDRFLASLSHELRTPLSPVVLALDTIVNDPALPEHVRADLTMIRRNIDLETRLIDDLLDLSRVITGKLQLKLEPCHLHDLLSNVLTMLAPEIGAKHVTLIRAFDAPSDVVNGDRARLQQVFWNLIRNAVKFTASGGRIGVSTSAAPKGQIRITVSDTGIGLSPDVIPKIFEPFEQGDGRITREFGGLGLGLAICKSVVDLHEGMIGAHSDGLHCGAVFHVDLPLGSSALCPVTPVAESKPIDAAPRPLRILLVEDHPDTARMLTRILTRWGYEVYHASSIAAALDRSKHDHFDALISDLGLPDGTGHELIRALHLHWPDLPGIAISGYGMEADLRKSQESGFREHLVKPLNLTSLNESLSRLVRSKTPEAVEPNIPISH